jgi:signal transduction histidine kinase/DNA-binding response OmpR family regulator
MEFEELLNIVLEELSRVVDYSGANVQLLEGEHMVVIGSRGQENHRMTVGDTLSIHTATPIRQVIENQEPLIINDTRRDYADFFAQPNHRHIGSWLGVPLTYGINILGVMTLNKDTDKFFTPDHVEVILAFANQVAVALQNARLFDEARQQVRQLAALTEVAQSLIRALDLNEVLNLVLDAVFELVGNHKGSVWLVDILSQTVKMADTKNVPGFLVELFNESHVSLTSEPFASVIESGEIQVLQGHNIKKDNALNYGFPFPADVTYVPLKTESGVIGVLAIETVIHNRNMLKLVTTLADLAAVAIESARLLENTRRHAAEMQNLYNLGVEVTRTLEVRQVMQTVIANTLTLTNSQLGAILFTDDQTGQQLLEWVAPTPQPAQDQSLLWAGLNQQMALTRQPLLLAQADLPDKIDPADPALTTVVKNLGIRAILGVPIFGQSEMNGGLFVASLAAPYFSSQDVQSLSFVATQASVAIRNATSMQRLNQLRQELEDRVALRTEELARTLQDLTEERDRVQTLYQIARELSASFDLDRVLNEALNLINGVIGISQGAILLLNRETGQLVYRAALGRDKTLPRGGQPTPYKIGYGLAGAVVEKRQPRLVLDLQHDPDWVETEDDGGERRSAIAVPLSTGDDVLGVLLLFHPDYGYFTEDHLKLVTAASAQIATTVNNAELYRLITDQAKRLGALYRQQASEAAKNQAILEGITDGVLVLDADGHIVLLNPKGAEILNIQFAQVENQPLSQILPLAENPLEPDLSHLFYHNMQKALDVMQKGQSSAQFRIETGAKAIMVSLAPVALGGEDRPSIVAVLRDITREAEIDRLKNEFISTVSHELRTPMTSIKGYADLLLSGNARIGALNETQHRFVKVIQSNANRLTELVNDILEISRIETGRIKLEFIALDIAALIKEVSISFEGQMVQKAMHLTLHLPNDLPTVYADKARLTQILVNLIGNAWQYTPEGGHINVFAKRAGNFVQVDVADTGIGIVEKDIAYIFDRFFRSERTEVQVVDGTGLGLSITKSFVDMIGGEIWVKSKLDVGTTFSFTVPIYQNTEMTLVDSPGKAQLLLIEDDPVIVDMLRPKLTQHGYEVVALENRQDALQFVHDHAGSINAIMLDLALKSSNGVTLLNQLKENHSTADIPVVLTSLLIKAKRKPVSSQIIEVISPITPDKIITDRVRQQLTRLPKAEGGVDTSPLEELSKGQSAILIIENNRDLSGRLKDLLSAHGYQVQCAFNSPQAVDMIYGNKPALVFLNMAMPEVEQESMLAFLRHTEDTQDIPVVLIADEELLNRRTKLLNQLLWTNNHKSVSRAVADLIIEMRALAPKN